MDTNAGQPSTSSASPEQTTSSSSHHTIVIAVVTTAVLTSFFIGIGCLIYKKLKPRLKNKKVTSPTSVGYGNPLLDTELRSDLWKYQAGIENSVNKQSFSRQNDSTIESGQSKPGKWQDYKPIKDTMLTISKPSQLATENQHVSHEPQQVDLQESHLELGTLGRVGPLGFRPSSMPMSASLGPTSLAPHEMIQKPVLEQSNLTQTPPMATFHSSHSSEDLVKFSDVSIDGNMNFSFEGLGSNTLKQQLSNIMLDQEKDISADKYHEVPSRQSLTEHGSSFNNAILLAENFGPQAIPVPNSSMTTSLSAYPGKKSNTAVSAAFNFTPQFVPPLPLPPALVSAAILKEKTGPPVLEAKPSIAVKSAAAAFGKKSSEIDAGSQAIPTESILLSVPVKSVAAAFASQPQLVEMPSSYSAANAQPSVPVKTVATTFDNMQAPEEEVIGRPSPSFSRQPIIPGGETYVSEMAKFYSSQSLSSAASAPSSEIVQGKHVLFTATPVAAGNPFAQPSALAPSDMKLAGINRPHISAALNAEDLSQSELITYENPQAAPNPHDNTYSQGISKESEGVSFGQNSQAQSYGLIVPISALVQDNGQLVFPSTDQHIPQVGLRLPTGGEAVPSVPDSLSDNVGSFPPIPSSTVSDTSLPGLKAPLPPPPPPRPPRPSAETVNTTQTPTAPAQSPLSKPLSSPLPPSRVSQSMNAPPPPPPPPLLSTKGLSQPALSAITDPKIPLPPPPPPPPVSAVKGPPTAPTPPPPPPLLASKGLTDPKTSQALSFASPPPPPPVPKSKGPPVPPPVPGPPKGPPPPPQASKSSKPPQIPLPASAQNLQKLKPLHWDKVRADPSQSMVWDRLKTGSFELNEDEISALFGTKPSVNNVVTKAPLPIKRKGILDTKKAQNIAIQLRALNISTQDICDALLEGSGMKVELLEVLVKMTPSPDEQKALLEFSGDRAELSPAERFLKSVLEIPNAFQRLQAMLFRSCFKDDLAGVQESLKGLEAACVEVRENRLFLKLLEAVLKMGNRLNMGTNRGEAEAFKLDALLRLSDVKAGDGKTTLLQFVVEEIIRSEGLKALRTTSSGDDSALENLSASDVQTKENEVKRKGLEVVWQLCTELRSVKAAAEVDADALNQSVLKLSNGLQLIQTRLKTSFQEQAQSMNIFATKDTFGANMEAFCVQAETVVLKLKEDVTGVFERVKRVTGYFHGTARETQPLRLFVIVRDFLGMLEKVCKDLARSLKMNLRG